MARYARSADAILIIAAIAVMIVAVVGWQSPSILARIGGPTLAVAALVIIAGLAFTIATVRRWRQGLGVKTRISGSVVVKVLLLTSAATVTGVVSRIGLEDTHGYSQNARWRDRACEWSITNSHGSVNVCVSHAKWLAIGVNNNRVAFGFLGILCAVVAAVLALFRYEEPISALTLG